MNRYRILFLTSRCPFVSKGIRNVSVRMIRDLLCAMSPLRENIRVTIRDVISHWGLEATSECASIAIQDWRIARILPGRIC